MKSTLNVFISLILLISVSGCSFMLKSYDDTDERRIAELSEKNKQLATEAEALKRRAPRIQRRVNSLTEENRQLQDEIVGLESKLSEYGGDVPRAMPETVTQVASTQTKAKPKAAPAKVATAKPKVMTPQQAKPQKKLTAAGAKLMKIARDKGIVKPEPEAPAPAPTPQKPAVAAPAPQKVASAKPVQKAKSPKIPAQKIKPIKKAKPQSVRLKVLSGTGKLFSAQKMTKTLYDMGYKSEKMDMAPRSNFTQNTVYYAKGHKDTAENIKNNLGGKTITKPLSWNSAFDVIVAVAAPAPTPQKPAVAAPAPQKVASAKPVQKAKSPKIPAQKIKPIKKAKPQSVRLKVLSGTGKLFSAQKMTKTLYDMGYKSEKMDMAPRSNFTQNTVYYAKGHQDAAKNIKKNLGRDTVLKPLSWNSAFDIIVVAGP